MAKDIEIVLGAKDQATAILEKLAAETKSVGNSVKKMADSSSAGASRMSKAFAGLQAAAGPLLAAFAAFKAIQGTFGFFGSAAAAADVQAEAERSLAKAIELAGDATGPTIAQHKAWASQLQQVANVGDEVTLGLMKQASMLGISNENLQDVTKAAIGLSEATGIGLDEALKKVNETVNGNNDALADVLPSIRNMATAEEKLAAVSKLAADGLAQKSERAKTAQGAGERLANSWGDFKEVIGSALEPVRLLISSGLATLVEVVQTAVIPAIQAFVPSAESMGSIMETVRDVIIQAVTFIEVVVGNLPTVWEIAKASTELQLTSMAESVKHFFTVVIPAYATWFGENFFNIIRDAFVAATTVISNFQQNVVDSFLALFEWMRSGFSGGTSGLFKRLGEAWSRDLLDGFKATTDSLPDVAARQVTAREKELMGAIDSMTNDIAGQYNSLLSDRMAAVGESAGKAMLDGINLAGIQASETGKGVLKELGAVQASQGRLLSRGSGGNPLLDEARKQTKASEQIAKNTDPSNRPVGTGTVLQLEQVGS